MTMTRPHGTQEHLRSLLLTGLCGLVLAGFLAVRIEAHRKDVSTLMNKLFTFSHTLRHEGRDEIMDEEIIHQDRPNLTETKSSLIRSRPRQNCNLSINSRSEEAQAFLAAHFENRMFVTYSLRERAEHRMLAEPAFIDGFIDLMRERSLDIAEQRTESFVDDPPIEVAERMAALDVIAIAAEGHEHSRQGRDALAFLIKYLGDTIDENISIATRKVLYVEKMEAFGHIARVRPDLGRDVIQSIKDPTLRRLLDADPPDPIGPEVSCLPKHG